MIHAYAIDPEMLVEWSKNPLAGRFICDSFGLGKPRILAELPKLKNWRKKFRQLTANLGDLEQQRLTALFETLTENMAHRNSSEFDNTSPWIDNAEREHLREPFKAILSTINPRKNDCVLTHNSFGEWPDELWKASRGIIIPRNAKMMAEAIAPMLQNSQRILFIDPYFRANRPSHQEPLFHFLKKSIEYRDCFTNFCVEVHVSADYQNAQQPEFFRKECEGKLTKTIPSDLPIIIKRWKQRVGGEKLHNRYILTNIGGVTLGVGLDNGNEGETDDLALLDREPYCHRWKQYASKNPAFDLELEFEIKYPN